MVNLYTDHCQYVSTIEVSEIILASTKKEKNIWIVWERTMTNISANFC